MAGSIGREGWGASEGCRAEERGIVGDGRGGEGLKRDSTDEKASGETEHYEGIKRENELKPEEGGGRGEEGMTGKKPSRRGMGELGGCR